MARIAGVDIPREKRLEISLTYIYGIGRTVAQQVCDNTGMSRDTRVRDLTEEEVARLRAAIGRRNRDEGSTFGEEDVRQVQGDPPARFRARHLRGPAAQAAAGLGATYGSYCRRRHPA